jgi:hypothetical protein
MIRHTNYTAMSNSIVDGMYQLSLNTHQEDMMRELLSVDEGQALFIVNSIGGIGKTVFGQWLWATKDFVYIPITGCMSDI